MLSHRDGRLRAAFSFCGFGFFVFFRLRAVWIFCLCAGIRDLLACFTRRPCAGRHLLFFAAAKKSRQKKAANTASSSICLRAPKGSYASHGNMPFRARCQRSLCTPHPLLAPASQHAAPDSPAPPRWQTVCWLSHHTGQRSARNTSPAFQSEVMHVRRESLRTVCHLDGTNHSLTPALAWVPEAGETSIRSAGNEHQPGHCRVKHGDVGGPWIRIRAGGVSRFLLPTFLCGGKEK